MSKFLILGMSPTVFFIVCLVVFIVVLIVMVLMLQSKYKKAVKGHLLCEIRFKDGTSDSMLMPVKDGKIEAPKSHNVPGGMYFTRPKKEFSAFYPVGMPKMVQVSCKKVYLTEGNPEPDDPFDHEPMVTAQVLHASINEKFSQLMLESANELYDKLEDIVKMIKLNPTFVYVGLIGAILVGIVALYFNFQMSGQIKGLVNTVNAIKAGLGK